MDFQKYINALKTMRVNKVILLRVLKIALWVVAAAAVTLFVFGAGMFVGFHKANFSYRWAERYHQNFGGPRGGFFEDFRGKDFIDAHGTAGSVLSVDGNVVTIKGRGDTEKVIVINGDTAIRLRGGAGTSTDIAVGDDVVTIGAPDEQGEIAAKLIRIFRH